MPGSSVLHYLPQFAQIHAHWVNDAIWGSHHLLSASFVFSVPQHESLFPWINSLHQSIGGGHYFGTSNEYSGLISFRIDWFGLLAVQRALKNILQHHNSKVSTLQHSALFVVQLSHLYITTGKTLALTIQTFVNKVMSAFYCGRAIIVNMTSVCQACALQMDMPWNSFHVSVNQVHVNSSWTDLWLDLLLGS